MAGWDRGGQGRRAGHGRRGRWHQGTRAHQDARQRSPPQRAQALGPHDVAHRGAHAGALSERAGLRQDLHPLQWSHHQTRRGAPQAASQCKAPDGHVGRRNRWEAEICANIEAGELLPVLGQAAKVGEGDAARAVDVNFVHHSLDLGHGEPQAAVQKHLLQLARAHHCPAVVHRAEHVGHPGQAVQPREPVRIHRVLGRLPLELQRRRDVLETNAPPRRELNSLHNGHPLRATCSGRFGKHRLQLWPRQRNVAPCAPRVRLTALHRGREVMRCVSEFSS